jgi:hypothetical protein
VWAKEREVKTLKTVEFEQIMQKIHKKPIGIGRQ